MVKEDKVKQTFDLAKQGSADAQSKTQRIADDDTHPNQDEAKEVMEGAPEPDQP